MEDFDLKSDETLAANASIGNRIVAYLIDAIIAGVVSLVPFVGWIASLAYMLTRDSLPFLEGQSVGKKLMKIQAVTEDGQPLTDNYVPGIIRNVVLLIPFFGVVELIVLLNDQQKMLRLGDQWAKTRVVMA